MRKNILILLMGILGITSIIFDCNLFAINTAYAQESGKGSDENKEDSADPETENGKGKEKCPTGGVANNKCPIWNVTYTTSNKPPFGELVVSCTTGGEYKCQKGICPHGN